MRFDIGILVGAVAVLVIEYLAMRQLSFAKGVLTRLDIIEDFIELDYNPLEDAEPLTDDEIADLLDGGE